MLLSGGLSGLLPDARIGRRVPSDRSRRHAVANQRRLCAERGVAAETLISNATANGQARTKTKSHSISMVQTGQWPCMTACECEADALQCSPARAARCSSMLLRDWCTHERRDETTLIMAPGCGVGASPSGATWATENAQARRLSGCREHAAAEPSGSIRGGDRHAIARNVACGARSTANGRRWLRECGFGLPRDPCCWRQDAAKRESYLLLLARRSHHAPTPALRTPQYRRPCPNMTGLVVLSSWSCPSPGAGASPLSKRKSTCTFCGPFG